MSKPLGVIYFTPQKTELAKDVAAAIRAEGNFANLVYAHLFRGPEDCVGCHAVMIQKSFNGRSKIIDAYRKTMPTVEIHMFTDNGDFVAPEDDDEPAAAFTLPGANKPVDPEPTDEGQTAQADTPVQSEAEVHPAADSEAGNAVNPGLGDSEGEETEQPQ